MNYWQTAAIAIFGIANLAIFLIGFYQSRKKKNPLGRTLSLFPIGIFVWGDAVIFGVFWFLVSLITLLLTDWVLFLLIFSVFWVVRSLGETIFFFNQQFSEIVRVKPKDLPLYKVIKDDYALWFMAQTMNQCITVVSIIASVYLFNLWLF